MNILVVGTIRNAGRNFQQDYYLLHKALSKLAEVQTFLIESDSNFQSIAILQDTTRNFKKFSFKSLGTLVDVIPNRIERIRYCRNQYVNYIRNYHKTANWDFIVVADLDGINRKISRSAINSSFLSSLNWYGCFANQKNGYYDLYALRCNNWVTENIFSEYQLLKQFTPFTPTFKNRYLRWIEEFQHFDRLRVQAIYSKMRIISPNENWISVNSAFGGLGIYRPEVFLRFNYDSQNLAPTSYCEHVDLHYQCIQGGLQLYINPAMINSHWNEYNLNRLKTIRFLKELKKFTKEKNY